MDDLKLFARSDAQLEVLLRTVHMFSNDVRLLLGLDKWARLSVRRGKIGLSGPLTLSPDVSIHELNTGEFYRYLGFLNLKV